MGSPSYLHSHPTADNWSAVILTPPTVLRRAPLCRFMAMPYGRITYSGIFFDIVAAEQDMAGDRRARGLPEELAQGHRRPWMEALHETGRAAARPFCSP